MEDPQILDQGHNLPQEEANLYYSPQIKSLLNGAAGFATLCAIFFGLNLLISLATSYMTATEIGEISIITSLFIGVLISAIIYGILIYYTYMFGKDVKKGLGLDAIDLVEDGLNNMKRFFKFLGILTMIPLFFIALGVLFSIISNLF